MQCTCKGFETDLVRLWQKFRTHNFDHVEMELPKANCSFCRHPLSQHSAPKPDSHKTTHPPLQTEHARSVLRNMYGQLSRKASANISLSVAAHCTSVALQLPENIDDCKKMQSIIVSRVDSTGNEELELSVVTHEFRTIEMKIEMDSLSEGEITGENCNSSEEPLVPAASKAPNDDAKREGTASMEEDGKSKSQTTKRGQKRKPSKSTSSESKRRRSTRIAEMKKKDERAERDNGMAWKKKSKLEALLEERGFEDDVVTRQLTESEVKYLNGNAIEFVQSFGDKVSFRSYGKLPQVCVCVYMYVHKVTFSAPVSIWREICKYMTFTFISTIL